MDLAFLLAVMAAFLWGFANIFAKLSTTKLGMTRIVSLMVVIQGLTYFGGFYFWHNNVAIDLRYGTVALAAGFIGFFGYICFLESTVEGQVAIVGTIAAASPCFTVIAAMAFLSESLAAPQLIGVAAIIAGIIALSYERNPNSQYSIPARSLLFAVLAFVLSGLWSLVAKIAISKLGPGNVFGFYAISAVFAPLVYICYRRIRPAPMKIENPTGISWVFGAAALAFDVLGALVLSLALSTGLVSVVAPVGNAAPVVTVTAAVLLLGEKLNRLQLVALACVITGVLMIGIIG